MTLLQLPYAYRGEILPGPRFRRTRRGIIRAEALVEVPDLGRGDMEEAVRIPSGGRFGDRPDPPAAPCSIHRRKGGDGRLFAPLAMRGLPLRAEDVREAFREPVDETGEFARSADFDARRYPSAGSRHRAVETNALLRATLGTSARRWNWPAARIVASDHQDREGEAVAYLSEAFAFVDGELWAECPEPAWMVRHVAGRRFELVAMLRPWLWGAQDSFRLDRRDRALEYADRRGRRLLAGDVARPVEIAEPAAVERDDVAEVALATLTAWPTLRYLRHLHVSTRPEVTELERVTDMGVLPRWEIPTVMDSVAALLAELATPISRQQADRYAEKGALYGGAARWAFEKPGLDMSDFAVLSEDDLEALRGLEAF